MRYRSPMRAAQVTPRHSVAAMDRTPPSAPGRQARVRLPGPVRRTDLVRLRWPGRIARLPGLVIALLSACANPPADSAAPPQPLPAGPVDPAPPVTPTRTANHDARGAGMQPDYDGEATALREHMLSRLPAPLPTDRRAACTGMLDAAARFYNEIAAPGDPRTKLLADLQSTRADDLTRCERDTSVRAATCVQLRLRDRDAELPWLLDQCTRAFPD